MGKRGWRLFIFLIVFFSICTVMSQACVFDSDCNQPAGETCVAGTCTVAGGCTCYPTGACGSCSGTCTGSCSDPKTSCQGSPGSYACLCTPQCAGKECGSDGCGGSCAPNSCAAGKTCNGAGVCQPDCPTSLGSCGASAIPHSTQNDAYYCNGGLQNRYCFLCDQGYTYSGGACVVATGQCTCTPGGVCGATNLCGAVGACFGSCGAGQTCAYGSSSHDYSCVSVPACQGADGCTPPATGCTGTTPWTCALHGRVFRAMIRVLPMLVGDRLFARSRC